MLIRESKNTLRQYHINLQKFDVSVLQTEDDVTATVMFASKITGKIFYVECHYNEEEVLQTEVYL